MAVPTGVVEDIIRRLLPDIIPDFPGIARDTVSVLKKGWHRTTYKDALTRAGLVFQDPPAVLVLGEVRGGLFPRPGEFTSPTLTLPSIAVPSITVPDIALPGVPTIPAVSIIRVQRVNWATRLQNDYEQACKDTLGDWGLFNWMRDLICFFARAVGFVAGTALNFIWDKIVGDQIGHVQDEMQEKVNQVRVAIDGAVQDLRDKTQATISDWRGTLQKALNGFRDNAQASLDGFRADAQEGLNKITGFATAALNQIVPMVWDHLGLDEADLFTPIPFRRVQTTGFEFYVPGQAKVHYLAVGVRG